MTITILQLRQYGGASHNWTEMLTETIPSPLPNIDRSTKPTEEEQLTHTVDRYP